MLDVFNERATQLVEDVGVEEIEELHVAKQLDRRLRQRRQVEAGLAFARRFGEIADSAVFYPVSVLPGWLQPVLETLVSPLVEVMTPLGEELRALLPAFLSRYAASISRSSEPGTMSSRIG